MRDMRNAKLAVLAIASCLVLTGCRPQQPSDDFVLGNGFFDPMKLVRDIDKPKIGGNSQPGRGPVLPKFGPEDAYTGRGVPAKHQPGTFYFAPEDAPKCPPLVLTRRFTGGAATEVFDFQGKVTIIFLAGTTARGDQSLFCYGRDLLARKEYRRPDSRRSLYPELQAKAIIERTFGADKVAVFFRYQRIKYPFYYDDLDCDAQKTLANIVGAKERVWPVTCIVDRKGRIRFYRTGFKSNSISVSPRPGYNPKGRDAVIQERVPDGHRIRDYLEYILKNP